MLTTNSLIRAFDRNTQIIKMQAAGLTQADSLLQLPFRANCLNWVIGHILTNRLAIFRLLEVAELPFDPQLLDRYQRESEPITGVEPGVLALEQLLALLDQTQARLAEVLPAMSEADFQRQVGVYSPDNLAPVANWLFFYYFHDTYHTGQTEILRQAAGVADKII